MILGIVKAGLTWRCLSGLCAQVLSLEHGASGGGPQSRNATAMMRSVQKGRW